MVEVCILGEGELRRALELSYRTKLRDIEKTASYKNDPVTYKNERAAFYREKFQCERYAEALLRGETVLFGVLKRQTLFGAALLNKETGEILFMGHVKKNGDQIQAYLLYEMALCMIKKHPEMSLQVFPEDETVQALRRLGFASKRDAFGRIGFFMSCADVIKAGRPCARVKHFYRASKILFFSLAAIFLVALTKVQLGRFQVTGKFSVPEKRVPHSEGPQDTVRDIPVYQAENLSYQVKEKTYASESAPEKRFYTSFEGVYPEISGMKNARAEEKINKAIEDAARETERRFVTEPSMEVKKYMVSKAPVVASKAEGRLTFATEDLISVVIEEKAIAGDQNRTRMALYSRVLDAKTGDIYTLSDVVKTDEAFCRMWKKKLQKAYPDLKLFDQTDEKALSEKFQKGEWHPENCLQSVFFLTKDKVEIGFSYYRDDGKNGYVTVDMTPQDLAHYQKDKTFWETYRKTIENSR